MRDNVVEKLFSVFASSDRAGALAGDLADERRQRGWIWYWLHVLRVTLVLWRSASTEAPLRMLALALAACVLFTAPAFAGVAAVLLFPLSVGSAASWIALSLFWCSPRRPPFSSSPFPVRGFCAPDSAAVASCRQGSERRWPPGNDLR
jgi:hypothetical protein